MTNNKKSVVTSVAALALAASVFAGGAGAAFAKEGSPSTDTKGKAADKAAVAVEAAKTTTEAPREEVDVNDQRGRQTESGEANEQRGRGNEKEANDVVQHQEEKG